MVTGCLPTLANIYQGPTTLAFTTFHCSIQSPFFQTRSWGMLWLRINRVVSRWRRRRSRCKSTIVSMSLTIGSSIKIMKDFIVDIRFVWRLIYDQTCSAQCFTAGAGISQALSKAHLYHVDGPKIKPTSFSLKGIENVPGTRTLTLYNLCGSFMVAFPPVQRSAMREWFPWHCPELACLMLLRRGSHEFITCRKES